MIRSLNVRLYDLNCVKPSQDFKTHAFVAPLTSFKKRKSNLYLPIERCVFVFYPGVAYCTAQKTLTRMSSSRENSPSFKDLLTGESPQQTPDDMENER